MAPDLLHRHFNRKYFQAKLVCYAVDQQIVAIYLNPHTDLLLIYPQSIRPHNHQISACRVFLSHKSLIFVGYPITKLISLLLRDDLHVFKFR